jgi:hypothetical protein
MELDEEFGIFEDVKMNPKSYNFLSIKNMHNDM